MADYPQTLLEIVHHIVHQHPPLAPLVEQVAVAAQGRNSPPQSQRKVLDPTTITEEEARAFFQQAANMNNSLVQSIAKELGRAKVVFDVGANSGFFRKRFLTPVLKGSSCCLSRSQI